MSGKGLNIATIKKVDCFSSLLVGLSSLADLVLNLKSSETLMVEDLTDVAFVEVEVSVRKVDKADDGDKDQHPRVVTTALGIERIITELITVGQVMNVVLFFPGVASSVGREGVLMVPHREVVLVSVVV